MSDVNVAIADLQKRVARLEDELAIAKLLATYGLTVDGEEAERAGNLWTEDGTYDAQIVSFKNRAEIIAMVSGPMHQGIIKGGAAHVVGVPLINIDGDTAVATCYGRLYRKDQGDRFYVWRVTAVRWELIRTPEGWRVTARINKVLDGGQDARDLLASGLPPA